MIDFFLIMPWYFPWSESIKKRACRYLLQHYLGDFLKEKLDLDQLTVDLYNGKGTVRNVLLDVWALNEMLANAGVPVELIDGYISSISVSVPWKALLNDSCEIEIHGLSLTFAPKYKTSGGLVDSTYSWASLSMTTSIQLAQECLRQEPSPGEEQADAAQSFEGLEAFAQTIESVLARVKLSFIGTFIRFEHIPLDSTTGIGIDLLIDSAFHIENSSVIRQKDESQDRGFYKSAIRPCMEYCCHAGTGTPSCYLELLDSLQKRICSTVGPSLAASLESLAHRQNMASLSLFYRIDYWDLSHEEMGQDNIPQHSVYEPVAIAIKNFQMMGLSVMLDEFPKDKRTRIREADDDNLHSLDDEYKFNLKEIENNVEDLLPRLKLLSSTGKQNVKVKLKQNDALPGPKVGIDYSAGGMSILMTPRQLHLVIDALSSIDSGSVGNDHNGHTDENQRKTKMRMMKSEDYMKVEETLQSQFRATTETLQQPNWNQAIENFKLNTDHSLNSTGTSHSEEEFFSMTEFPLPALGQPSLLNTVRQETGIMTISPRSTLSNVSLGGSSSSTSTKGTLVEKASTIFRVGSSGSLAKLAAAGYTPQSNNMNVGLAGISSLDDSLDVTSLKLRISNIIVLLLHGDPLGSSKQEEQIHDMRLEELNAHFFRNVDQHSKQNLFGINEEDVREKLVSICCYDHLRFLASAITIETEQRVMTGARSLNCDIIVGKLSVDENLYKTRKSSNNKYPYSKAKLLQFLKQEEHPLYPGSFGASQSPCIKLKLHKTNRTSSMMVQSRTSIPTKSSATIELGTFTIDIDITMMDRLVALLWPGPLYKTTGSTYNSFNNMYGSLATGKSANQQTAFRQVIDDTPIMLDQKTDFAIKFPNATILLRFPKPDLRPPGNLEKTPWWRKDIQKESLKFLLTGGEFKTTIHSVQGTSSYEILFKKTKGYFLTDQMSYHLFNIESTPEEGETGSMGIDMPRVLFNFLPPSRSVFEDLESPSKNSSPDSIEDQYPWIKKEPSPFSSKPHMYDENEEVMITIQQTLVCSPVNMKKPAIPNKEHTRMTFSLHVDKGNIALFPPSKDVSPDLTSSTPTPEVEHKNGELAQHYGHVVLNLKDGHFFLASGYKGQANLDFLEIYSNSLELHHNDVMNESIDICDMDDALSATSSATIYPSEDFVQSKFSSSRKENEDTPMLALAMKCVADPNGRKKDNLVALALHGGTMHYRSLPPGHMWIMQLMDFIDIKDYPIEGYTLPKSITTLHVHLLECAIDYKPLYLPTYSLLTMGSFSLSSNLIPGSSTSILRFVVEDSTFHLCNKSKNNDTSFAEYVPVMDMGLFELSLKLTDGLDKSQPLTELSMSNSMLYIRTCSDSCIALMDIIKYFASDGDLQPNQNDTPEETELVPDTPIPSQNLFDGETDDSAASIDSLMADAMNEDEGSDHVDQGDKKLFEGTLIDQCIDSFYGDDDEDGPSSSDEFCFLEGGLSHQEQKDQPPTVRKLVSQDIVIKDNFFQPPLGKLDQLGSPDGYPIPVYKYTVKEMSVVWQMYGGNDFDTTLVPLQAYICEFEQGKCLLGTISPTGSPRDNAYLGRRTDSLLRDASRKSSSKADNKNKVARVPGGPNRDLNTLMELQMNKIRFIHEIYPSDEKQIYRDVLLIYDLELRDRLITSQINKFLYQYSSESLPKQSSANMVSVKFLVTKPEDAARSEEASLKISLQPLRLNVDQDSLFFLKGFFSEIFDPKPIKTSHPVAPPELNTYLSSSPGQEPFQTVSDSPPTAATPLVHSNENIKTEKVSNCLFIKTFLFSPEVPIRLDYQGKHVDIEQGTLAGLIIGLSQLNCSELRLKRLCNRSGLLGLEKLVNYVIMEWLNDIKVNQLQSILGGVGPTYSFVKLFQGVKDLFWMPVQQYKQDGRIVRGLQRGAHSFSTSTAMAMLELSNRLVTTIQSLAELTFDMVSPGPSHVSSLKSRNHSSQSVHPAELREGVANAYTVLSEGLTQTASNIVRVATEEHEKKGVTGAVGGVLRQIPPTVVKPLILATEATSNVLGGAMNQLAPDKRREALEKWKSECDT